MKEKKCAGINVSIAFILFEIVYNFYPEKDMLFLTYKRIYLCIFNFKADLFAYENWPISYCDCK